MPARRIAHGRPPSQAEEAKLLRKQALVRNAAGQHLRYLRITAGLSLRAMAVRANASPTYWSEVERGMRSPTTDFLVRASCCFGVSVTSLLDGL